jgi:hypothetical protein
VYPNALDGNWNDGRGVGTADDLAYQGRWATRRVLGCLGRPSATPRLWSARGAPVAA